MGRFSKTTRQRSRKVVMNHHYRLFLLLKSTGKVSGSCHCFNSIEEIWCEVKDFVATENENCTFTEVRNLILQGYEKAEKNGSWAKRVKRAWREVDKFANLT